MALVPALLLNPTSSRGFRGVKWQGAGKDKVMPAGRPKTSRGRAWRKLVKRLRVKKAAAQWRRGGKRRSNPRGWYDASKKHGKASRKGWKARKGGKKGYAKAHGKKRGHFLRNPFKLGGRKGSFELIPSLNTLKGAAVRGIGAVASDVVRATGYSLLGRVSGSLAEDALGRLVAGALTGAAAGYIFGPAIGSAVVEGSYTVALYKLVADAAAKASGGKPKLFGFIANPFTEVSAKPFLPGFGATGALPAPSPEEEMAGLSAYTPEGEVVPLGAVIPEGEVVPLGLDEEEPARFRARL